MNAVWTWFTSCGNAAGGGPLIWLGIALCAFVMVFWIVRLQFRIIHWMSEADRYETLLIEHRAGSFYWRNEALKAAALINELRKNK